MHKVVVTGVSKVGKSYIIQNTLKKSDSILKHYVVVDFGNLIVNLANENYSFLEYLSRNRVGLIPINNIPKKWLEYFQIEASRFIKEIYSSKDIIVHCRSIVRVHHKIFPGVNNQMLKVLWPDIIILVLDDPNEILKRLHNSGQRIRLETVIRCQEYSKKLLWEKYNQQQIPLTILDGSVDDKLSKFINTIKSLNNK